MRRLLVSFALISALLASMLAVSAAAPTNFSGTWVLDKSKSKDLPPQWANVESYTLTVTQDDKQLTVQTEIKRGENASGGPGGGPGAGGGQGGGRGRGGFGMGPMNATYKLDGTETKAEATGDRPGAATFKAEVKNDGKSLQLTTKRTFNFQGNEVTATTTELWELSADGKVLTIQRTSETPRGTQNSTLVFNKQ